MQHRPNADCIFCAAAGSTDGAENLILNRGEKAFVILNRFPYTSGHLMIVPFEHVPSIEDLDSTVRAAAMEMVNHSIKVLRAVYHPDAFNVGMNIGAAAGAGVASHVHFHVVPRWGGDTNFMSTLAGARVLPEELAQTWHRLRERWDNS